MNRSVVNYTDFKRLFCGGGLFGGCQFLRVGEIVDGNSKKHVQQRVFRTTVKFVKFKSSSSSSSSDNGADSSNITPRTISHHENKVKMTRH